ncbi:hypothetical protein [Thiohalocapsa marina]|uniref:hypothetical protein n=1 Tax=Thiohalocapsa marina TaxID=424902 RepID=UPI0036DECFB7
MKQPRFTDTHRYPHGYRPAAATDIRKTFARIERQQQRAAVVEGWPSVEVPQWTPVVQSWADAVRVDWWTTTRSAGGMKPAGMSKKTNSTNY